MRPLLPRLVRRGRESILAYPAVVRCPSAIGSKTEAGLERELKWCGRPAKSAREEGGLTPSIETHESPRDISASPGAPAEGETKAALPTGTASEWRSKLREYSEAFRFDPSQKSGPLLPVTFGLKPTGH